MTIKEIADVIREKNALPQLLNEMSTKEVAAAFMQTDKLISDLQDQIHDLKLQAIKWDIMPVDCKAPTYNEFGEELILKDIAAYIADDDTFSNQGESGLCARHACGKALLGEWRGNLGRKHPMDLRSVIAFLITSIPKGSKSAKVTDYDKVVGQIADPDTQKVYEMEIQVFAAPNQGNICVVDLGKIW